MRKWNLCKNVMLAITITMLYAIWSKEGLHEVSTIHMWAILIMVGALILHLLVWIDREFKRINKERRERKNEKIEKGANKTESTKKQL